VLFVVWRCADEGITQFGTHTVLNRTMRTFGRNNTHVCTRHTRVWVAAATQHPSLPSRS
jgi:hypothetical protein